MTVLTAVINILMAIGIAFGLPSGSIGVDQDPGSGGRLLW